MKLRQEVKVKVDIVTSDDIKIYNTGKFQDTARYIIKNIIALIQVQTAHNVQSDDDLQHLQKVPEFR